MATQRAYNSAMHVRHCKLLVAGLLLVICASAQQATSPDSLTISAKELPKASLWEPYNFQLQASGGTLPYHWRVISGSMPLRLNLRGNGELGGIPDELGQFEFSVLVTDNSSAPQQQKQKFILGMETPLVAEWGRKAQVNGTRIDGSLKVSNRTGRDFDLTVIVLAVNDISRATAIGYQHFPLKKDTQDFEISFGDTLSPGDYAVNVDVVGEETISNRIFRARLVTGKEQVTQGP